MDHQTRIMPGYIPKYRQLLQILRDRILAGEFSPGEKIPSAEELTITYEVSLGTVRKALAQLEAERLIRTEHGIGSFVLPVHPNAVPFHFTELPYPEGKLTYKVMAQDVISAPMDVAERLRLLPGTRVIHIARQRILEGQIVAHTMRYLSEDLCPLVVHEDLTVQSVHELLVKNSELPLLRAEIEVEAHKLTAEEAQLLGEEAGSLAIAVERLTYTAPNRPAVWYKGLFKSSYHFGAEVGEIDSYFESPVV